MTIKTSPPQPLPKLAIPLGLIVAGFAFYGLVTGVWDLLSAGALVKEGRTGGGMGTSQPFFVQVSGMAAWLHVLGLAGLVATGLSAVVAWLRARFVVVFPLTVMLLVLSNLLSG